MTKIKFRKPISIAVTLLSTIIYAQPNLAWQKLLGGSNSDLAMCIVEAHDGGYITAGRSYSNDVDVSGNHGFFDLWIVKTDVSGNVLWQKSIGGSQDDNARTIKRTADGGYIIGGETASIDGDAVGTSFGSDDYWLVKITGDGLIQWQKRYGGFNSDTLNEVAPTLDGGYIMAGTSAYGQGMVTSYLGGSDAWIVKVSGNGTYQWQKTIGGSNVDVATGILALADGSYVLSGFTNSTDGNVTALHGALDAWIVKLNATGNIIWEKTYGGSDVDIANTIKPTADGGYIFAGRTSSNDGQVSGNHSSNPINPSFFAPDLWVVKINGDGILEWQKCLGSWANEEARSVEATIDGGYIVTGNTDVPNNQEGDVTGTHGGDDIWIAKLSATGQLQWQKAFGGGTTDDAYGVIQTSDGSYVIAGFTDSSEIVANHNNSSSDIWIIKLAAEPLSNTAFEPGVFSIFPNPTSTRINISPAVDVNNFVVTIADVSGKIIFRGENTVCIDVTVFARGIYFMYVSDGQKTVSHKFVKE